MFFDVANTDCRSYNNTVMTLYNKVGHSNDNERKSDLSSLYIHHIFNSRLYLIFQILLYLYVSLFVVGRLWLSSRAVVLQPEGQQFNP